MNERLAFGYGTGGHGGDAPPRAYALREPRAETAAVPASARWVWSF